MRHDQSITRDLEHVGNVNEDAIRAQAFRHN